MARTDELAYSTARADRLAAQAERAATTLDQLAVRFTELPAMLPSINSARNIGDSPRTPHGPRSPLRLDVLSLMREIAAAAKAWHMNASTELHVSGRITGTTAEARTLARLAALARRMDTLYRTHDRQAHTIATEAWRLDTRAGLILNLRSRAFALPDNCPDCGYSSLWVDPERGQVVCTVPACGYRHAIDTALLVHTVDATSPA